MSVKERVEQLRLQAAQEAERQRQLEEEERAKAQRLLTERQATWDKNLPETIASMKRLYKRLERQGVIAMIEEGSGVPTSEWQTPFSKPQPIPKEAKLTKLPALSETDLFKAVSREWWIHTPNPYFFAEPVWDPVLQIKVTSNNPNFGWIASRPGDEIRSWEVTYQMEILTIQGEQMEYDDLIPRRRDRRVEVIESALARAIYRPKVFSPQLEAPRTDLFPPTFGGIFVGPVTV